MKTSITVGAAVGLATGAWMFAEYAMGLHADPDGAGRWTGFLSLVFPILGSVYVVRKTRPTTRGAALREGAIFGAVGGIIGSSAILLYFLVLNPGFSADGKPVDPGTQAFIGFTGSLALGMLVTVIVHALVRGKGAADV